MVTDMPVDQATTSTVVLVVTAIAVPLFGFLSVIANWVFKIRSETRGARSEAVKAREGISEVKANTEGFDGFPDRLDGKLDELLARSARMESRLTRVEGTLIGHLEWHMKGRHRNDR